MNLLRISLFYMLVQIAKLYNDWNLSIDFELLKTIRIRDSYSGFRNCLKSSLWELSSDFKSCTKLEMKLMNHAHIVAPCGAITHSKTDPNHKIKTLTILCPKFLWLKLEMIKLDMPFGGPQCKDGYIMLDHLLGIPSTIIYCGRRVPETLHAEAFVKLTKNTQDHDLEMIIKYEYVDKQRYIIGQRLPTIPDLHYSLKKMNFFYGKQDNISIESIPQQLIFASGIEKISLLFLADIHVGFSLDIQVVDCEITLYDGPGPLSPILAAKNTSRQTIYDFRVMFSVFLEVYYDRDKCPDAKVQSTTSSTHRITDLWIFKEIRQEKVNNTINRSPIHCSQIFYDIRLDNMNKEIEFHVNSSSTINNWCGLVAEYNVWTFSLQLKYNGPAHYVTQQVDYYCQFGGVYILLSPNEASPPQELCENTYIEAESMNSKDVLLILVQFYDGYSSGDATITIKPIARFPIAINQGDFTCSGRYCLNQMRVWEYNVVNFYDPDGEAKANRKRGYLLVYPNPLFMAASPYRIYRVSIDAGNQNGNMNLGLVSLKINLFCGGKTSCQLYILIGNGIQKITYNEHSFYGNVNDTLFIKHARYIHTTITFQQLDKVSYHWFVEKVTDCSLSDADEVKQIPMSGCSNITIPFHISTAYLLVQFFQTIKIRVPSTCSVRDCINIQVTARTGIQNSYTLVWNNTKLQYSSIYVDFLGYLSLQWQLTDECLAKNLTKHKLNLCDIVVDIGRRTIDISSFLKVSWTGKYFVILPHKKVEEIIFRNV